MTARSVKSKHPLNLSSMAVLAILVLGLAVTTQLVNIQTLFSPKAEEQAVTFAGNGVSTNSSGQFVTTNPTVQVKLTSPFALNTSSQNNAQPIYQDSLSNNKSGQYPLQEYNSEGGLNRAYYENNSYILYGADGMKVTADEPKFNLGKSDYSSGFDFNSVSKDLRQYTMVYDFAFTGTDPNEFIGAFIGSDANGCSEGKGQNGIDCYRISVSKKGTVELDYQEKNQYTIRQSLRKEQQKISLQNNKWYTLRVDRATDKVSMWVSQDNGSSWTQLADSWALDPKKANSVNRNFNGLLLGRYVDSNNIAHGSANANYKNLKIWKLGQFSASTQSVSYRYSADLGSIQGDPNGDRVKWQTLTSNPIVVQQTFSSDPGTKVFFAQFKSGSNVSQIYQGNIILQSATNPNPNPNPNNPNPNPAPQGQNYSMCGKSGLLAQGYQALTSCAAGTYLVVDSYGGYVQPSCRTVPAGFVQDPQNVCNVKAVTQIVPGNVCLSNAGYMCGDSNGKTRSGKNCTLYQGNLNSGCASDNVYPYCFSGCN